MNQGIHQCRVLLGGSVLEGADAQMGGGDASQDGSGQGLFPVHRIATAHHCQTAGGGHAEGMHGFADQVFAQHRPQRCPAVPATGEGGAPSPLELNIHPVAAGIQVFSQQDRTTIPQHGQVAELMTGIGLGQWLTTGNQGVAAEQVRTGAQGVCLQSHLLRQSGIEQHHFRLADRLRRAQRKQRLGQLCVAVIETKSKRG